MNGIRWSSHAQRGQTFPIWAFGTLTVLTMLALAMSYGQMVAWQMRAMNAADAAARGMLSVQTTQWNETEAALHAAAVEEYRLRVTMNDLLEVIHGDGGCKGSTPSCATLYANLRQNYLDSLSRYTNDVAIVGRVSTPTWSNQVSLIQSALSQYQTNCGTASGGDCAFNYTLVEATPRPSTYTEDVYADCCNMVVGGGTSGHPKLDLTPMQIEIVACARVTPWMPTFWNWNGSAVNVVGRAAATSIQDTQEFMWVGSMVDPASSSSAVFQPSEYPESSDDQTAGFSNNDRYYRVDYGGNPNNTYNPGDPSTSDGSGGFTYSASHPGLYVADGWWSTMAIKPFAGALSAGSSFTCK
ncbi:MAG TPA: pilus assembly protein TadG-related protein [Candidatus Dormibacteraeota bacterium]|nr:pilus assembly protein TadG-related protein [Candidatus Dormibacteraeota bacterium]